jgi:hypothetical protein
MWIHFPFHKYISFIFDMLNLKENKLKCVSEKKNERKSEWKSYFIAFKN